MKSLLSIIITVLSFSMLHSAVTVTTGTDEGLDCFTVTTSSAVYTFDIAGGGIISLNDNDGNDWISHNAASGAAGMYHGIPNLVDAGNIFHPGDVNCTTVLTSSSSTKVTLTCDSKNGLWQTVWDFYDKGVIMTVTKAAANYWFLYEGTPGGTFSAPNDYYVVPDGTKSTCSAAKGGDLPESKSGNGEWIYFGDNALSRVLFIKHFEDDDAADEYFQLSGQMTVMGFGREGMASNLSGKNSFAFGLVEDTDHATVKTAIENFPENECDEVIVPEFELKTIDAGVCAQGRAFADIDMDGYIDVIVAEGEFAPFTFSWYKYPDWTKYPINNSALSQLNYVPDCQTADMDGDGDDDIIVPNSRNSGNKAIYWFENPTIGGGSPTAGGFTQHTIWEQSDRHIKDIGVTDLDKDGKLDIVARLDVKIHFIYQNSADSWTTSTVTAPEHEGMDVGDIDGDGYDDVICNGYWLRNPGNRTGTWTQRAIDTQWYTGQGHLGWQDNSCRVEIADIDGDGVADPVISHSEASGFPVSWYSATDRVNGPWTEHQIAMVDYCHSLQAGDFDNDGTLDIMTGQHSTASSPEIALYLNKNGDGSTFEKLVAGNISTYIAKAADIGNDGDLDIVGSRDYNKTPIDFLENVAGGGGGSGTPIELPGTWSYIEVDDARTNLSSGMGAFGLDIGDMTGDGYGDIISGEYFYRNPGGDMTAAWPTTKLPLGVDTRLIVNVDDDVYADAIAVRDGGDVYWLEADDVLGSAWTAHQIGTIEDNTHGSGQGFGIAEIYGGGKPEIIINGARWGSNRFNMYYFIIPTSNPTAGNWTKKLMTADATEDGLALGDIDNDGHIDVTSGYHDGNSIKWWKNPGNNGENWAIQDVNTFPRNGGWPDVVRMADLDGDTDLDILVSRESGLNGEVYWYENGGSWQMRTICTGYSKNSMDVADFDGDGDIDVVTGDHKSSSKLLQIHENDGTGTSWTSHTVEAQNREHHLGTRVADLDGDNDFDIISITFADPSYVHVWRNDNANPCGACCRVDPPILAPDGDGSTGSVTVTMTTRTSGANIYYSTDGSDPTTSSILYTGPVTFTESVDLKARTLKGSQSSIITEASYTVIKDYTNPVLVSVVSTASSTVINVAFSETVSEATAQDTDNYSIDNGITVTAAVQESDGKSVTLTLGQSLNEGGFYTLTANGIKDRSGNSIEADSRGMFIYYAIETPDGLVAAWDLDESSGDALDFTGNGHDGTVHGATRLATGKRGGALTFDGNDDYVDAGVFDITGGTGLTIEFWMNASSYATDDARMVSKATGTGEQDHYWMISTTNSGGMRLRFRLKTGGTTTTLVASSGTLPTGEWVHVAATYDGSHMRLYLNGTDVGNRTKTGAISTGGAGVNIGRNPGGYGTFDGSLDEVRIYNYALTSGEFDGNYLPPRYRMTSFSAVEDASTITLNWSTSMEVDNQGWNIYRKKDSDTGFTQLNSTLIAGNGTTTEAQDYSFADTDAADDVIYYYYLDQVDMADSAVVVPQILTVDKRPVGMDDNPGGIFGTMIPERLSNPVTHREMQQLMTQSGYRCFTLAGSPVSVNAINGAGLFVFHKTGYRSVVRLVVE